MLKNGLNEKDLNLYMKEHGHQAEITDEVTFILSSDIMSEADLSDEDTLRCCACGRVTAKQYTNEKGKKYWALTSVGADVCENGEAAE